MFLKCFSKLAIVFSIMLLSSCAAFKPNVYDQESKVFNNYKMNYSVRIPENYTFVEKTTKLDPFARQIFSGLGSEGDAVMSYKHHPILCTFFAQKELLADNFQTSLDRALGEENSLNRLMTGIANEEAFKESVKADLDSRLTRTKFKPTSIHISSQGRYLIISIIVETQLLDIHVNVAVTYFKPNPDVREYYSFNAVSVNFPASTSIAHEDLSRFIKSVELGKHLPEDRFKVN